jgi:glyoxylase-like metal-dependent hydrolase (beta-lactamase superfamily II)
MSSDIFSLRLGINSCYLIRGKSTIMVDGGPPNKLRAFRRKLGRLYIHPEEIKLVVLTHSHFDHVGSAEQISELTGAKIIAHEEERYFLENSKLAMIKGVDLWGKITLPVFFPFFKLISYPKVETDIFFSEKEYSLDEFGVDGKILHTPGHTSGSLSILLNTGEAFVGCLAHNGWPFRSTPGLPIYAQNIDLIKESWRLLIAKGARTVFPGHGKPFPIDVIKRKLLS